MLGGWVADRRLAIPRGSVVARGVGTTPPEEMNPTRAGGQRVPQVCTLYRLALGELVSFPRMSLPNIALHLGVLEVPDDSDAEIYSRRSGCE